MAINGQQTAADVNNPPVTQYRWYKSNSMVDPHRQLNGANKIVTCTIYDDVEIKVLGLLSDISAGSEQAVCDDQTQLAAVGWETIRPSGSTSDYSVTLISQEWDSISVTVGLLNLTTLTLW